MSPIRWPSLASLLLVALAAGCGTPASSLEPASSDETAAPPRADGLRLRLNADDALGVTSVDIVGLPAAVRSAFGELTAEAQAKALSVFVAGGASDRPAILGTRSVAGEALRFTPRFPLARGMSYRVAVKTDPSSDDAADLAEARFLDFETEPLPAAAPTEVTHIYPTTDRLPENQLKFYIHFSAAMSRGQAYRHVHLLDAEGREMADVFLELGEELWDPAMCRFTLLCDPARVKRGLRPREELGAVLEAGQDYTLVVDGDWADANGRLLAAPARKVFHVLAPDEVPVDPGRWRIESPKAGGCDPLVVRFPEPLDHALLRRMIQVVGAAGKRTKGAIEVSDAETRWQFTPDEPWPAGNYELVVDTDLEDLAGNAIGRQFDADMFGPIQKRIETETVSIPFAVESTKAN